MTRAPGPDAAVGGRARSVAGRRAGGALAQAINCDDPDQAARIIRDALGIERDDVVNYCFPKDWPADREWRARIIGEWLTTEARFPV